MIPSLVCIVCGRRYYQMPAYCGGCWHAGYIVDVGHRLPAAVDGEAEVLSARELARMAWQSVESRRYPGIRIGRGAFIVATGEPGHGKSSLVTGLLDGITAPVLLMSVEEPPGPALAARLMRVGVKREDFGVVGRASVDQLVARLRETKAVALGLDSIQPSMLTARDVRHVLAVVPTLHVVVATAQVNAQGAIAGVREVEHEADVVLDVERMRWSIRKSRYQKSRHEDPDAAGEVRLAHVDEVAA